MQERITSPTRCTTTFSRDESGVFMNFAGLVLVLAGSRWQTAGCYNWESTRRERTGSSEISWMFALIIAVFTFWPSCSLASFAADKCAVTMRVGQMKTGLCAVPSNSNNGRSYSCSFPTAEDTYGLQHLPAEIWVAKRDSVCQDGRAVYEVEKKPLSLLSHAPGSRGCKSPTFKTNWRHKVHPSTNTGYRRISQAFHFMLWYSRLNKLPVCYHCFNTFSAAWGQSSSGGSWTWHLVLSADQERSHWWNKLIFHIHFLPASLALASTPPGAQDQEKVRKVCEKRSVLVGLLFSPRTWA